MSRRLPPPQGCSAWARRTWIELTTRLDFQDYELLALERALGWWDRSDAWLLEAASLEGAAQGAMVKRALDAAQTGLRFWRTLKFSTTDAACCRTPRSAEF